MKYTDLTEEQRKHFDILVSNHKVPEDARYFDLHDHTRSSFMKECTGSLYYLSDRDEWIFYSGDYSSEISQQFIQIPEKPWSLDTNTSTDVALKNPKEESQMIGKWYTVTDPDSDYVNLTGECVDYDQHFGEITLKFPHKCKMQFTKDQLVHETIKEVLDSVRGGASEDKPSGSSNSYYWIEIPLDRVKIDTEKGTVGFMLEQYLKFGLDNDFDRCNLAKTNHRIGKKPGNDDTYEIEKLAYYSEQIKKNWGK